MDPEILLIDEVLAVGDQDFQRKCLGKIKNISELDRTVLFVSHNMTAIKSLCNKAIVIRNGEIVFKDTHKAVNYYLKGTESLIKKEYKWNLDNANGDKKVKNSFN